MEHPGKIRNSTVSLEQSKKLMPNLAALTRSRLEKNAFVTSSFNVQSTWQCLGADDEKRQWGKLVNSFGSSMTNLLAARSEKWLLVNLPIDFQNQGNTNIL